MCNKKKLHRGHREDAELHREEQRPRIRAKTYSDAETTQKQVQHEKDSSALNRYKFCKYSATMVETRINSNLFELHELKPVLDLFQKKNFPEMMLKQVQHEKDSLALQGQGLRTRI